MTNLLIAQNAAEQDGVNLLPLIVITLLLAAAATVLYLRKKRSPQ